MDPRAARVRIRGACAHRTDTEPARTAGDRALTPRLPFAPKYVPGPPKRFAQGIGATLSVAALILYFAFGETGAAYVLVAMIVVAATLESVFAVCLGCKLFAVLMRVGVIPESVCEECGDIWRGDRRGRDRQVGAGV